MSLIYFNYYLMVKLKYSISVFVTHLLIVPRANLKKSIIYLSVPSPISLRRRILANQKPQGHFSFSRSGNPDQIPFYGEYLFLILTKTCINNGCRNLTWYVSFRCFITFVISCLTLLYLNDCIWWVCKNINLVCKSLQKVCKFIF